MEEDEGEKLRYRGPDGDISEFQVGNRVIKRRRIVWRAGELKHHRRDGCVERINGEWIINGGHGVSRGKDEE